LAGTFPHVCGDSGIGEHGRRKAWFRRKHLTPEQKPVVSGRDSRGGVAGRLQRGIEDG
jgi:hypothetical protein